MRNVTECQLIVILTLTMTLRHYETVQCQCSHITGDLDLCSLVTTAKDVNLRVKAL